MSQENPNFTIIAPGGCNSKCDFCTDPYNGQWNRNYIPLLKEALENVVPGNFQQCSISGGEPTLSPVFNEILAVARHHFPKVVLTSNGARITNHLHSIITNVDHLNISRHAIGYDANTEIFKTNAIIDDEQLQAVCAVMNKRGIDVNLNHVYTKDSTYTKDYVHDYVKYAKQLGANSVSFRFDQSENSLDETYLEALFNGYKVVNRGGCPVCRNHTILVDGMQVVFKASFEEPSNTIKDVYELIFHTDGRLCTDWGGKNEFKPSTYKPMVNPYNTSNFQFTHGRPRVIPVQPYSSGGGCGSKSRGGGCGSGGGNNFS